MAQRWVICGKCHGRTADLPLCYAVGRARLCGVSDQFFVAPPAYVFVSVKPLVRMLPIAKHGMALPVPLAMR